jgi:hypothetical protein
MMNVPVIMLSDREPHYAPFRDPFSQTPLVVIVFHTN